MESPSVAFVFGCLNTMYCGFQQERSASMSLRILVAGHSRQRELQDRSPATTSKMHLDSEANLMLLVVDAYQCFQGHSIACTARCSLQPTMYLWQI